MSVVIEIENAVNLRKARRLSGVSSNVETVELALEEYIKVRESKLSKRKKEDLPRSYWDDLFSQPQIPSNVVIKAIEDEREDRF